MAKKIFKTEIEIRQPTIKNSFFKNIIIPNETFDACICNPPFFESEEQARLSNWKKWNRGREGEKQKVRSLLARFPKWFAKVVKKDLSPT